MKFKYILKQSNRKTLGIEINKDGKIMVKAPKSISQKQIDEILLKKSKWIENKISDIQGRKNKVWNFEKNCTIPFLGKEFKMEIFEAKSKKNFIKFLNNRFNFFIEEKFLKDEYLKKEVCMKVLKNFYKEIGKSYLENKTREFEKIIGVKCNNIKIKDVKSIWGSCSSNNNINYNLRLMIMDEDLIDYVVVHELCHLIHKNHSKNFWNEVEKYVFNYEERKNKIQESGQYYNL